MPSAVLLLSTVRVPVLIAAVLLACGAGGSHLGPAPEPLLSYTDSIPGTLVRFNMVAVPGGRVRVHESDGVREVDVAPFWLGATEVTWDEYDVFAFRLDLTVQQSASGADAEARPSRPYGAPDRGMGHRGFPAIGMTYDAATAYAAWLSEKTGRKYRLPTDDEWTLAAQAGLGAVPAHASDGLAWHADNSGGTTRRAGSGAPDRLGLFDMAGNVAEWVTNRDGRPLVRGGSFLDPAHVVGPEARASQTPQWNETDPQFPKSRWWLSDAPFVGFRIMSSRGASTASDEGSTRPTR